MDEDIAYAGNGYQYNSALQEGAQGQALSQNIKNPHLSDLAEYADRIAKATEVVAAFNDRFRPAPINAVAEKGQLPPVGHAGNIRQLGSAIARLEAAVSVLGTIG